MVAGFKQGKNVTNITGLDDKQFKMHLTHIYSGQTFDYLVLGSSRIKTLSRDAVKGASVLNLGISMGKIREMASLYQSCVDNGITLKNVIIGVDPVTFMPNVALPYQMIPLYKELMGKPLSIRDYYDICLSVFSHDYFVYVINSWIESMKNGKMVFTDSYVNELMTFRTDASIYNDRVLREQKPSLEEADEAFKMYFDGMYDSFPDEYREAFEKLVETIEKNGTEVHVYLCPSAPYVINRLSEQSGYREIAKYINEYAQKHKDITFGNLEMEKMGLDESDFYDTGHLRKEVLDRVISQGLGL
jgi:hypothetical protein